MVMFFSWVEVIPFNSTGLCHQSWYLVLILCDPTAVIFLKLSAQSSLPPCGKCCTLHWAYIIRRKIKCFIFITTFFFSSNKSNAWGLGHTNDCQSTDKSMCLVAKDFHMRHGAASQGMLFPTQLLTNSFLCPKCAADFQCGEREEDPKWLHFSLSVIRWQAASAWLRSFGPGPPQLFSLLCSQKKSSPVLHLRNWGLGWNSWFLSALLSSPCCVQTFSQAVEWSGNQRNFFLSFLQLWHGSAECHSVLETNVF